MNQIYTAGYAGHTPAQLKRGADELGAYVIDIRYSPRSRQPGWNGEELEALLGDSYIWCRAFGNINHANGGEISMPHLSIGMKHLSRWVKERPLILLCGCAEAENCHRREIARILESVGWTVPELPWPVEVAVGTVPCLSLWQPWATLIAIGAKRIETRGWATNYRGPLAIHAAKNTTQIEVCRELEFSEHLQGWIDDWEGEKLDHHLPLGAIVAVADLVDCVPITGAMAEQISDQERNFGDYGPGRFGWVLENVRRLKTPIPQRGAQKLFNVTLPGSIMAHFNTPKEKSSGNIQYE